MKWIYGVLILFVLILSGIDFLCPYRYDEQFREYAYHPPQALQQVEFTCVDRGQKLYQANIQKPIHIKWFVKGYEYRFLGLKTTLHLWGTLNHRPVFIFGADQFGRDVFFTFAVGVARVLRDRNDWGYFNIYPRHGDRWFIWLLWRKN